MATDATAAGGWGEAWSNGHFDMLGHAQGTLTLDGKTYHIDSVDAMDHGWRPRPEWDMGSIGWQMMTFGPDLALHILLPLELRGERTHYGPLTFGHMCENGKIVGLVSAEIQAVKQGRFPKSQPVTLTDELGRIWIMEGEAVSWAPWHTSYPSFIIWGGLFRWTMGDRAGHSNVTEVFGTCTLGRLARAARL